VVLPAGVAPFASEDLNQDDTYSHAFTVKGAYKYVCKYHEGMGMTGTVVVS
jgi:plastocyanin